MKQIITVGIGGRSFILETEAYENLKNYLDAFRTKSSLGVQSPQIMEDLEERIAEILSSKVGSVKNVVSVQTVDEIISQLGMPDGTPYQKENSNQGQSAHQQSAEQSANYYQPQIKKIYRDTDDRRIAGVSGGIACYFNIDSLLVRLIFVVLFILGLSGLLIYIILWIVIPKAITPAQKCEQRGWPITAENLAKFNKS